MPELPEVETVRRQLEPVLVGRRLRRVEIFDSRLVRPHDPAEVTALLLGARIAMLERRGKYLVVRLTGGHSLVIHLRMTGSLRHAAAGQLGDDPYRRAFVELDDGSELGYRDVRRFGTWLVMEDGALELYLAARLGGEPLSRAFTARSLAGRLRHRRAPIKAALLDQRTVAGLGNIYVDEALWRARVHPLTRADELTAVDVRLLRAAIRTTLERGIARQGATLRDYSTPKGTRGQMQDAFKVYGREGEPCERCGTPVEKIRCAGRGTWYCPRCQTARRPAAGGGPRRPAPPAYAAERSSRPPLRSRRQSSV